MGKGVGAKQGEVCGLKNYSHCVFILLALWKQLISFKLHIPIKVQGSCEVLSRTEDVGTADLTNKNGEQGIYFRISNKQLKNMYFLCNA